MADNNEQNDRAARNAQQSLMEKGYTVSRSSSGWRVINRDGQVYKDSLSDSALIELDATAGEGAEGGEEPEGDGSAHEPGTPMKTSEIPIFTQKPDLKAAFASTGQPISMTASGKIIIGEKTAEPADLKPLASGAVRASDIPMFKKYPDFAKGLRESGALVSVQTDGTVVVDGQEVLDGPDPNPEPAPEPTPEEPEQEPQQ